MPTISKTNLDSNEPQQKPSWRKVLYENQPYPDNYTEDKIFLQGLKKNIDFKEVSFLEAAQVKTFGPWGNEAKSLMKQICQKIKHPKTLSFITQRISLAIQHPADTGANLLLQEFCTVVLFVLVYIYIVNKWTEPALILNITTILTLCGFILYLYKFKGSIKQKLGHDLRTVLTFVVFGQLFSPVLHTLTDTISTDTIYTLTFLMMLIHLIFFDYGVGAAVVSKSLSLSAAIFPSICLASRLSSASEAFILLTVATKAFVLFPLLRMEIHNSVVISAILLTINLYFLYRISFLATALFFAAALLINLICPILFVKYQTFKDNIYGPWDEAVVDDADNIIRKSD